MRFATSSALIMVAFLSNGAMLKQETNNGNLDIEKLLKQIRPTWSESGWSQIPWMLDLTAARKKASDEGKPLFVWSMSGEPLGQC